MYLSYQKWKKVYESMYTKRQTMQIALIMYVTILGAMTVTKTANMMKLVQNVTKVSIQ